MCPFDPMAGGGKPLRWGGSAEARVIYSVGGDGVDDAGSEVSTTAEKGPWERRDFVVRLWKRAAATTPSTTQRNSSGEGH
jgi:hypothetical protein